LAGDNSKALNVVELAFSAQEISADSSMKFINRSQIVNNPFADSV